MTALFVPGSSFTVIGNNSPTTFTDATPVLTAGTYSLGSGVLNLTLSIVNDGPTDQWLVFQYERVGPGALSAPSDAWLITESGLDAATALYLTGSYAAFLVNGVPQSMTGDVFGGGYSLMSNPVPGGSGSGTGDLSLSIATGPGPILDLVTGISPWSDLLALGGVDETTCNGVYLAIKFSPQSPPEPPGIPAPFCGDVHTATSLKFAWTPTGGAASSFTVDWRKVGDMSFTEVTGITDDFLVVTGLTPGTTYEFKVKAVP